MWLLLSLLAFALAVASHAVLCRLPLRMDFVVKSLFAGAPIGVGLVSVLVIREGLIIETFAAALLYALLIELYIFSFTLVSTSVSVSLLLKLSARELTGEEIDALYSSKSMVESRFEKLVGANFLVRSGNGFSVTGKTRMVLIGFRTLRFFFRHATGSS